MSGRLHRSFAKVWNLNTGEELVTLLGHSGVVTSVAFSSDGQRLATAGGRRWVGVDGFQLSGYGKVLVYTMDTKELLRIARDRVTRTPTPDECKQYFQSTTCTPLSYPH